jgi:hypothetical protein
MDGACNILVRVDKCIQSLVIEPKEKGPRGRLRHVWEDNIKMGFKEIGMEVVDKIHLAHERGQ